MSLAPPNDHSRSTGITTTKILLPIPLSFLSIELRNFQLFSTQVTSLSLSPRPCLRAIFPTSSYFYKLRDPIFAFPPCETSPRFRLSDFSPLSLSSAKGRKAEGNERRWNGAVHNSVAVVAAERTATRRLVIHRVQVRFYLVTVCTPAETRLPSFQIGTNGPTIHIRGWAAACLSLVSGTRIAYVCIYKGPANSHG